MLRSSISVERYPYEEPCHLHLQFEATNGLISGTLDYYCNAHDLEDIGSSLSAFPKKVGDEYKYEIGSSNPKDNWAYHFMLRAFTTDLSGRCALQITLNNRSSPPYERTCTFSIQAEAAAINRLGNLFRRFAKLEHRKFVWTETDENLD